MNLNIHFNSQGNPNQGIARKDKEKHSKCKFPWSHSTPCLGHDAAGNKTRNPGFSSYFFMGFWQRQANRVRAIHLPYLGLVNQIKTKQPTAPHTLLRRIHLFPWSCCYWWLLKMHPSLKKSTALIGGLCRKSRYGHSKHLTATVAFQLESLIVQCNKQKQITICIVESHKYWKLSIRVAWI